MTVYRLENEVVTAIWSSVESLAEFTSKYPNLDTADLHVGKATRGQVLRDGHIVTLPRSDASLAAAVRLERDARMQVTDWRAVPDYPNADAQEWMTYRQELRDITEQAGFPSSIYWPIEP
jgi:hypothetical protein